MNTITIKASDANQVINDPFQEIICILTKQIKLLKDKPKLQEERKNILKMWINLRDEQNKTKD